MFGKEAIFPVIINLCTGTLEELANFSDKYIDVIESRFYKLFYRDTGISLYSVCSDLISLSIKPVFCEVYRDT